MSAIYRYLPAEIDAIKWGLHVSDCGFTDVVPGSDYPPGKHPPEYDFSWEKGRTLHEYQLIYITEGRGVFENVATGRVKIEAGQVIILFPGEWHRYRPIKKVGWVENWIGFRGDYAEHLMNAFFSLSKPVFRVGHDEELLNLIRSVVDLTEQRPVGVQQLMAARTVEALARVRMLKMGYHKLDRRIAEKIQQARCYLLEHSEEDVDMEKLSSELGMSYSRFRSLFKTQTGTAPHHYLLDIRVNKAKDLLVNTRLTVSEIAEHLGFTSVYYFSRLFKNRAGMTPTQCRQK